MADDNFDEVFKAAVAGDLGAVDALRKRYEKKGGRPRNHARNFELAMWVEVACEHCNWKRTPAFQEAGSRFRSSTGQEVGEREARRIHSEAVGAKARFRMWLIHCLPDGFFCLGSLVELKKHYEQRLHPVHGHVYSQLVLKPSKKLVDGENCFAAFFEKSTF